jgi:hypothetical protein
MIKHFKLTVFLLIFTGCATYHAKYKNEDTKIDIATTKEVSHTFYLMGDAGLSPIGGMNPALKAFKARLNKANKNSTVIFLGDNIYPAGLPDPIDSTMAYRTAASHLNAQVSTLENFKGSKFFIPGNHDWYTEGLKGLKREQEYIQEALDSDEVFFPENGCPIETIEINDDVVVIAIDTEWYLTNWDKRPGINDKCDIKSRDKFLIELEDAIKDNRERTTILAMHHPMFSYGAHGGHTSLKQQLYPANRNIPLPILGSLANVLRKTAGPSIEDVNNSVYRDLRNKVTTLAQYSDKVIFASGHEHTLQYIVEKSTPQIVSGSGSKKGYTKLVNGSEFTTGQMGYAVLEVYKDGSSKVRFFGLDDNYNEIFLYGSEVLGQDLTVNDEKYDDKFPAFVEASVYSNEEVEKSKIHNIIWGKKYRDYYGVKIKAPTVLIDTLFGGLKPVKKGGGHQSKSLRLEDKDGKQYVMRAIRKSAELYLQSMVFQDQYVADDLKDTYAEKLLEDFYTGAHPFAPFTVATLSDAVDLYHTNPVLYYVPKQASLEQYNATFGNELYMIEEHTGDGHGDLKSFGYSNDLKSTDSMLEDLRDDEKYSVDSQLYIRARLFDMALGDWDRHTDQWRWAEFKDKDSKKVVYKPVPRDRDQVFSKMGDGVLMSIATRIVPGLRIMEGFNDEIRSVKGFNSSPKTYVLDMALLTETVEEDWIEQANFLKDNLTPEVIEEALKAMPEEVQDKKVEEIKATLLARLSTIEATAKEYYSILNKFAVVTGTDKDDWFEITCLNENQTQVKAYRNIDDKKKKLFFNKIFNKKTTKEIWVYGLDDDDIFEVKGEKNNSIRVRLIGGQNNDIYDIENSKKISLYDFKSKNNTLKNTKGAKVKLIDDYTVNTYQPLKLRYSTNQIIPTIGYNPDDGIKIGFSNTYTFNGFRQNPFTEKHGISASYYFATSGIEFAYKGEFAHIFENWNLEIATRMTSSNFAINFFGYGNETENLDDDLDLDYNRVKFETLKFAPSLVWRGRQGAKFKAGLLIETIEVEETSDRFINEFYQENGTETRKSFAGAEAEYTYENKDNPAFPTLGMGTALKVGYKKEIDDASEDSFAYVIPSLSFDYKLIPSGRLVLATKWKAHFNIGDNFEFYQGASIGGVDGLRGFRNQRFTGKTSYYQNTDLRFSLRKIHTSIVPSALGVFGGFDYGKVWFPGLSSDTWHTSYGGGFFLNAADIISINTALFNSEDGLRFSFGLGFAF